MLCDTVNIAPGSADCAPVLAVLPQSSSSAEISKASAKKELGGRQEDGRRGLEIEKRARNYHFTVSN